MLHKLKISKFWSRCGKENGKPAVTEEESKSIPQKLRLENLPIEILEEILGYYLLGEPLSRIAHTSKEQ